jgi:hypothetical protein
VLSEAAPAPVLHHTLSSLEERRKNQDLAQVYRYKEGIGRIEQNLFEKIDVREGAVTRAAAGYLNYKIPAARGEIRKNSFAVRTVREWNALPEKTKASRTCEQFKIGLKKMERALWEAPKMTPIEYMDVMANHESVKTTPSCLYPWGATEPKPQGNQGLCQRAY